MNIRLQNLQIITKEAVVDLDLSADATFIHGPISTGKSTVARLIDYCLGGSLERTPAIRNEFVSSVLFAKLGGFDVSFERGSEDNSVVRVTWKNDVGFSGAVNAPLDPSPSPILDPDVFSMSDLIYKLSDIDPIRVRRSKTDPESPLIRLSFRDLMWYCYLPQHLMDSSFFRMEDPFRAQKSKDVMRFITGLCSETMSQLETEIARLQALQSSKIQAVGEI